MPKEFLRLLCSSLCFLWLKPYAHLQSAISRMTPSPQIERPAGRVATNTIPLPGAALRRQVPGQRAKGANHRAVNPLVRGAFYVFIFSLLFEWPDRPIPMEI